MQEESPIYSIGVVTITGTQDIITMYPINLSHDFNREGYQDNKELKQKKMGVR